MLEINKIMVRKLDHLKSYEESGRHPAKLHTLGGAHSADANETSDHAIMCVTPPAAEE